MPLALRRIFWLCSVLCLAATLHAQTAPAFTSIVVFGDSLSDTGNVAHLTQSATLGTIRYPSDLPALSIDYTDGRFTDGADTQPPAEAYFGVWIEQLAASFAAKPTVINSLDGGTNYAYGDATTANTATTVTEGPLSISIPNMGQQVTAYLATNPAPNAGTLYVLWGGSNDVLDAAEAGNDPVAAAGTAVTNELALVQQLMAAGATNFLIPNIPPLGATPEGAASGAGTALNNASVAFATGLAQGLNALQQSATGTGQTLNIYQPDILTLFSTVATNPMAVGLGNVTSLAQNISGDPDTYLIWDGIHPTTSGHHYVAAAAANLITPLVASSTSLSAPAVVLADQPATVTITVASSASKAVPTGGVTLFANTTEIAAGPLNSSGVATVTVPANTVVAGNYTITAVYAGDTTFNESASPGQPGVVLGTAVATTTSLTASSANPNTGTSVTFTATVAPMVSTYGMPGGTVTFLNGTTSLGTGTLTNGTATFTTTALPAGTLSITASYAASGLFGASTSSAVTETVVAPAPSFTASASPTSLTIAGGGSGTTMLSAVGTGGFSGTLALACDDLPAQLACSFSSTMLTLAATGTPTPVTLTISNNASAALRIPARPRSWGAPEVLSATMLFPGLAGLLLLGVRRRRSSLRGLSLSVVLLLLSSGAALGLVGCGGSSSNKAAAGTYTVPVTFTPAAGAAQTVNISVTVQ